MSKTQQEIAAPKVRNNFSQNISLTALSITLTAISTFLIYAYQTDMFSSRTSLATGIVIMLSLLLIAEVIACIILKTALAAAVFGFFAALCFIFILLLKWLEVNNYTLIRNFTTAMATILFALIAYTLLTVFIIRLNKKSSQTILATLCAGVFAFSTLLCFFFYNPVFTSAQNIINPLYFSLSVSAALALICGVVCIATAKRKIITTKWITYCAMFAALGIVVKIMGNAVSFIPALKFSLVYLPWIIAGIVLGPSGGMVTALVSDILGQLILPSGVAGINPLTSLSNTLFPLFPALLYKYSPLKKDWLNILIGMVLSTCICTLGIGSYALWVKYYSSMSFWDYWLTWRIYQPIIIAVNYVIAISLLPVLHKLKLTKLKFVQLRKTEQPT